MNLDLNTYEAWAGRRRLRDYILPDLVASEEAELL